MLLGLSQESTCFPGPCLTQEHFEDDVGVYE